MIKIVCLKKLIVIIQPLPAPDTPEEYMPEAPATPQPELPVPESPMAPLIEPEVIEDLNESNYEPEPKRMRTESAEQEKAAVTAGHGIAACIKYTQVITLLSNYLITVG